jgi:hypothetical protein
MPRLTYHWSTAYWRYALSEWIDLALGTGLEIVGVREPRPTAEQVAQDPRLEDCGRMPYFLIVSLRKPGAAVSASGV